MIDGLRPHGVHAVFAVSASAAMLFASTGVNHLWPLAWIAPVPLLALVPQLDGGRTAAAAFCASAIGALNLVVAYHELPAALLVGAVLFLAVPFTVVVLLWRWLARRLQPPLAVLAYPALVVCAEYLVSAISPNGTFGSISYSQTDVLPVLQVASVTGLWGISFLLALVAAAVAVAWRCRLNAQPVLGGALAVAFVPLAAVLLGGGLRLAVREPARTVRVGLAASDATALAVDATDEATAMPVVRAYASRAVRLASSGATFVVLPEKFVGVRRAYEGEARWTLATAARQGRASVVAGLSVLTGDGDRPFSNRAIVFGPDGSALLEYDKIFLVPGLEARYRPGTTLGVIRSSPVPVGVAICKDLDFAPLGRKYARAGIGLLLVPAWDFERDAWLHSRMAIMRAVEGGYALARVATQGRLTVTNARGRVIAERESNEAPEVLLVADVPVAPGGTFYSQVGDWLPWASIAIVLGCAAVARGRPSTGGKVGPGLL